jgi:hypothetical protein
MSDITPVVPQEIGFARGTQRMKDSGYREVDFVPKWNEWLRRGDVILIFENQDMGNEALGHVVTMPWTEGDQTAGGDGPFPQNAPDNPALGLGWRYRTIYVIRKA